MGCTESCECSQENIDALQAVGNCLESNFVGGLHVPTIWKIGAAATAAFAITLLAFFWMKKRRERKRRKRQRRMMEQIELYKSITRQATEQANLRAEQPTEVQTTEAGEQERRLRR